MNTDANNIARLNAIGVESRRSLIDNHWIAKFSRCGSSEHIQPAWHDYGGSEARITGINQVNLGLALGLVHRIR
jgi:hypothetical protein